MADHETKAHNIFFTASLAATEKMRWTGTFDYNMSESGYNAVEFDEAEIAARTVTPEHPSGDLTHQSFDFSHMTTYSDFDYEMMRFALDLDYSVSPRLTLSAGGDYVDLTDNAGYVYGVESGSYFVVRGGVRLDF